MTFAKPLARAAAAALIAAAAAPPARAAIPSPANPSPAGPLLLAQAAASPARLHHGLGVVTAIEPDGSLTINHRPIEGLMPAMEMMFRVASPALSKGLRPGDEIEFDVEARQYTIQKLRVLRHIG